MKSSAKLRSLLLSVLAGANVLIICLSAYSLNQSRHLYELHAITASQNVASALDQTVEKSIEKIGIALGAVTDELERQIAHEGIDDEAMNKFMARGAARLPEIESLRASTAEGLVTLGNLVVKSNPIDISDRDYFVHHSDNAGDRLFISEPLFGRISKHHVVIFSKRFSFPDGRFAGVAYATIALDHFTSLMSKFEIGKLGTIALRDGKYGLMTRLPPLPDNPGGQIGNTLISPEFRKAMESGLPFATFIAAGPDGVQRRVSVRKLEQAPVIAIVGLACDEYLADWQSELFKTLVLAGSFMLISVLSAIALLRLIKKAEEREQKIRDLAFYDQLTGLPSLRLGEDRLEMALFQAKRQGCKAGVLFLDLDGFKTINDRFGHLAGDCVLKEVALRLNMNIRADDTAARIGGDEFLVILNALQDEDKASEVARKIIEVIGKPIAFEGQALIVGSSIGISVFPLHASDAEELRRAADAAMYVVKRSGKNNFAFYSEDEPAPKKTETP